MLLEACGYDKTFIDNIQYPGKANYLSRVETANREVYLQRTVSTDTMR